MMKRLRCDQTPVWASLKTCFETGGKSLDLRAAFVADAKRFEHFSQQAPHVFADLSKNLIDAATQAL
ncbi:MAG TPA: glucose-6-phosphate isomerase, partial [Polaromonas sp.]|nr:glucose-6-phosphate isomerase [Polaromonas sp.]